MTDFTELNDATLVALMTLKTAKMDYISSRKLRGQLITGHPYFIPFTEREIKGRKIRAEYSYEQSQLIFHALWKARRRLQRDTRKP